jgi:group II intron reverse transcriptase/maturase
MQTAETYLKIVADRGKRRLPLNSVYRQLQNPEWFLAAYAKIAHNHGAMTPGITQETVDGMNRERINAIVDDLVHERYRWSPVRRVYIAKKDTTTKRPLGIPEWKDKLVQEVLRQILETYYEPQFSDHSHGFRPNRGCHTALTEIERVWRGTVWFIEGDITGCYDHIDHDILLSLLGAKLQDQRLLRLLRNMLQAGYMEHWKWNQTYSGTPQGGILSPLLANIYLHELDQHIENVLQPEHTLGITKRGNPEYKNLESLRRYHRRKGHRDRVKALDTRLRGLPTRDTQDPSFRRVYYVRYADDFLLGVIGPREVAEKIKEQVGVFLKEQLKLELSQEKTKITHGRTAAARFLGYDLRILHDDAKPSVNGGIGLFIPQEVVGKYLKKYSRKGHAYHRPELLHDPAYDIVARYAAEYRGLVNYYCKAQNLRMMNKVRWRMEQSMLFTLAHKLRLSWAKVYRKMKSSNTLRWEVHRPEKSPLIATWERLPLTRKRNAVIRDHQPVYRWLNTVSLLEKRLAEPCVLCGATDTVEMHHVRRLATKVTPTDPLWKRMMVARHSKKIPVCWSCHHLGIHAERHRRAG